MCIKNPQHLSFHRDDIDDDSSAGLAYFQEGQGYALDMLHQTETGTKIWYYKIYVRVNLYSAGSLIPYYFKILPFFFFFFFSKK